MSMYSKIVILSACTLLEHEDMLSYNGSPQSALSYKNDL